MSNKDFYRAFEDKHRGSRELIRERVSVYLPFILPLKELYTDGIALDIGCGRGEWIELLTDNKIIAKGIDFDEGMLKACHLLNLDVVQGDGIEYLKKQDSESMIIISSFHVVEHISFEELQSLVVESLRVLRPGGLLILETPNPENIKVGTENFYLDPTHEKPIPASLLSFLPEFYGYARTKVIRLQEAKDLSNQDNVNLLQVLEGVSPDYSIVAQKPASKKILKKFNEIFSKDFGLSLSSLSGKFENRLLDIETKASEAEAKASEANINASEANIKASEAEAKASEAEAKASEAEAKASEANIKASEAEAKASEAEAKASEAEAKASEANIKASEAEAKASEAEAKASEAEAKASEAEAKASEAEAKASEANIKASEAEAKASEAEAKASEAEAKASEAEAKASEAEAKASEANIKASEAEVRTNDALHNYHSVVNSNSWKIMKPLRILGKFIRWFTTGVKHWITFSPTSRPRRVLKKILISVKNYINTNPRLKMKLVGILNNFPKLKKRLKRVGQVDHHEESRAFQVDEYTNENSEVQLSPEAKKIYNDLKQAIALKKGIN